MADGNDRSGVQQLRRFLHLAGWLFIALVALAGSIASVAWLLKFKSVPGPDGPGMGMAILLMIGCAVTSLTWLAISIFNRPPREDFTPIIVTFGLLLNMAIVAGAWLYIRMAAHP